MPTSFKLAFMALQLGGAIAILIALALKGPTRVVKILVVVYLVIVVGAFAVMMSPAAALRIMLFSLAGGALLPSLALLSWRVPIPRKLEPVDASAFPPHSWNEVRRRGEEATAAGLEWIGDCSYRYKIALQEGRGYQRFFATSDRTRWYYVHSITGGRLVVSYVSGVTAAGRCLRVAGGMDDFKLFPTPSVAVRTVSARMPVQQMLEAHEEFCREMGETVVATSNPIATHEEIHDRWVQDLIEAGTLKRAGDVAKPRLRAVPGCLLRQVGGWLR